MFAVFFILEERKNSFEYAYLLKGILEFLHDFFTKSEYLKLKNKLNIIKKALLLS
jgi:hypothetical protein